MQLGQIYWKTKRINRRRLTVILGSLYLAYFYLISFLIDCEPSMKESLRQKFARAANDFERRLRMISLHLSSMTGPLEVRLPCLSSSLHHRLFS